MSKSTAIVNIPFKLSRTHIDIFSALLRSRREFGGGKAAIVDPDGRTLTYTEIIRAAFALGSSLKAGTKPEEAVGVLLPTGIGATITFYALGAYNRVPAMLNFTAGFRSIALALRAAKITRIVTAHQFIEKGELQPLIDKLKDVAEIVYLEDVRENMGILDKAAGAIGPIVPWLIRRSASYKKVGVILFTSGTEGEPKGVVLSHQNIIANAEQARDQIALSSHTDKLFCPLPVFHVFGLTLGVVLPLTAGVQTYFYPTPLQPKEIARRIRKTGSTIMLATDTFVSQYARAGSEGDLDSIRIAVCGAERVKDETRQLVRRKYNIELLEGYGLTETSPIISSNTVDHNIPGTVGTFLPGIEHDLIPVEGIKEGGRLRVRGPNIMMGYLHPSNPGVIDAPPGGWLDTGDIVSIDENGIMRIKGRVKRFAKIGGEMVSLAIVENCASAIWPENMHASAALPDARKGEQIVLLTDARDANRAEMLAWAQNHGVPELAVPRKIFHVGEIPVLGTGKLDYGAINKLATSLSEE